MAVHELAQPLRGIIPPMVTPLSAPDELDHAATERLVEHLIAGGVHGLFLLGTCGEGPSLSGRLRRELVERVCRLVDRRVPVMVSIADTSLAESLAMARCAADAGADALVLAPPYYYPIEQSDLLAYVLRVVESVPLPVLLYHLPTLAKVSYDSDTIRRLMDEPRVVGLKDSSNDLDYFQRVRQLTLTRPDWSLLAGPDHLLARSLELGAAGGMCGGANICPQVFVQLYEAAIASCDTAMAEQKDVFTHLVDQVDRLQQIYKLGPPHVSGQITGLKAALSVMGIVENRVAEPIVAHSADEARQIARVLRSLGLVESAGVAQ